MKAVLLGAGALALTGMLSGCGAREMLVQPAGKPMPVAPYAAKAPQTSADLLAPPVQTRPARSDDLIVSADERRSDEFDLPPPN
jgi:hypothetical protein